MKNISHFTGQCQQISIQDKILVSVCFIIHITTFSKWFCFLYSITANKLHHTHIITKKGESVLKAEVQTWKEVRNYLSYVSYGHKEIILH